MPNYNLNLSDDGQGSLSFVHDGILTTIPQSHKHFARVLHALAEGHDPTDILSSGPSIDQVSDRVTVTPDAVLLDGEVIDNRLTATILRYEEEARDYSGLVKFMERLLHNPSARARKQLFDWAENAGLTIDPEGFIIAHKAVTTAGRYEYDDEVLAHAGFVASEPTETFFGDEDDEVTPATTDLVRSLTQGTAFVNDIQFTGHIPQWVGAVVSMPREQVDDDSGIDCSTGLHVGSFNYARGFGPRMEVVKIDPADVVSVPRYDGNKMRVCRYEVLEIQPEPQRDLSGYEAPGRATADTEEDIEEALAVLAEEYDVDDSFITRLRATINRLPREDDDEDDEDL